MDYLQAYQIARRIVDELAPFCSRIEIAGSIRRKKPEVKDIEIVCIPKSITVIEEGLFGGQKPRTERHPEFIRIVNGWKREIGHPFGKHTRRVLPEGIKLDLSMVTPENWGLIFATRTGSADYSHLVLARGWCMAGFESQDGMLWKDGNVIPVREEMDLFRLIGIPWLEPEKRNL